LLIVEGGECLVDVCADVCMTRREPHVISQKGMVVFGVAAGMWNKEIVDFALNRKIIGRLWP